MFFPPSLPANAAQENVITTSHASHFLIEVTMLLPDTAMTLIPLWLSSRALYSKTPECSKIRHISCLFPVFGRGENSTLCVFYVSRNNTHSFTAEEAFYFPPVTLPWDCSWKVCHWDFSLFPCSELDTCGRCWIVSLTETDALGHSLHKWSQFKCLACVWHLSLLLEHRG